MKLPCAGALLRVNVLNTLIPLSFQANTCALLQMSDVCVYRWHRTHVENQYIHTHSKQLRFLHPILRRCSPKIFKHFIYTTLFMRKRTRKPKRIPHVAWITRAFHFERFERACTSLLMHTLLHLGSGTHCIRFALVRSQQQHVRQKKLKSDVVLLLLHRRRLDQPSDVSAICRLLTICVVLRRRLPNNYRARQYAIYLQHRTTWRDGRTPKMPLKLSRMLWPTFLPCTNATAISWCGVKVTTNCFRFERLAFTRKKANFQIVGQTFWRCLAHYYY